MTNVFLKLSVYVPSNPFLAVQRGLGAYPSASIRSANIPCVIIQLQALDAARLSTHGLIHR